MFFKRNFIYGSILFTFCFPTVAKASLLKPDNTDNLFNRQTQQQQAQQQQFEAKAPDVSLLGPIVKTQLQFPEETPCFTIEQGAARATSLGSCTTSSQSSSWALHWY